MNVDKHSFRRRGGVIMPRILKIRRATALAFTTVASTGVC
jgi:hypothetical protein